MLLNTDHKAIKYASFVQFPNIISVYSIPIELRESIGIKRNEWRSTRFVIQLPPQKMNGKLGDS